MTHDEDWAENEEWEDFLRFLDEQERDVLLEQTDTQ